MKTLTITNRWNETLQFSWNNDLITTLKEANKYTVDNDEIGYFFEVENADQDWIKKEGIPVFEDEYGKLVAPNEYKVREVL